MLPLDRIAAQEKLISMAELHEMDPHDELEELPTNAVEIGAGHWLSKYTHYGNDSVRAQLEGGDVVCGFVEWHRTPAGELCAGAVSVCSTHPNRRNGAVWGMTGALENGDLTLSPSIQCTATGCGAHGFVRSGRWVSA